ncbi:MAG: hypothetical protein LBB25_01585 [Holosporaceae bacterium]|jgi:ATPase subunit of ABC transporter with duplicated ATPase domains|nr:hypothetical protein [Holosporaceae bacterium]
MDFKVDDAGIAAHPQMLLILDEIINSIDLETRNCVVEILCAYPTAIMIISQDENFWMKLKCCHAHITKYKF